MAHRRRPTYAPEFRAEAVKRVRKSTESVVGIARDLGIRDGHVMHRLRVIHAIHRRTSGRPRWQRALRDEGVRVSRKRVARLMRQAGLSAQGRRRFRITTDREHPGPVASNGLARQFATGVRWAADRRHSCIIPIAAVSTPATTIARCSTRAALR